MTIRNLKLGEALFLHLFRVTLIGIFPIIPQILATRIDLVFTYDRSASLAVSASERERARDLIPTTSARVPDPVAST